MFNDWPFSLVAHVEPFICCMTITLGLGFAGMICATDRVSRFWKVASFLLLLVNIIGSVVHLIRAAHIAAYIEESYVQLFANRRAFFIGSIIATGDILAQAFYGFVFNFIQFIIVYWAQVKTRCHSLILFVASCIPLGVVISAGWVQYNRQRYFFTVNSQCLLTVESVNVAIMVIPFLASRAKETNLADMKPGIRYHYFHLLKWLKLAQPFYMIYGVIRWLAAFYVLHSTEWEKDVDYKQLAFSIHYTILDINTISVLIPIFVKVFAMQQENAVQTIAAPKPKIFVTTPSTTVNQDLHFGYLSRQWRNRQSQE